MLNGEQTNIKQEIHKYIDGKLSEKETEELWSALIQKQEYYDYLQTATNLKPLNPPEGAVPAHYLRKLVYAGAAVLVLLIAVFASLRFTNTQPQSAVQPIASIELPFQRSADLTPTAAGDDTVIREAILLTYNGKFNEAVALLKSDLKKASSPDRIARLNIMLGTLYYNHDRFEQARSYFQKAAAYEDEIKPLRLEKAYWYLGNTWIQLSKFEKAKAAIRKVIKIDGAYSRVARDYLKNLENAGN